MMKMVSVILGVIFSIVVMVSCSQTVGEDEYVSNVNTYVSFCYGSHYECGGYVYNELIDENVEIWEVLDTVETNGKYVVIFSDNGTDTIYDDEIVQFVQIPEDF